MMTTTGKRFTPVKSLKPYSVFVEITLFNQTNQKNALFPLNRRWGLRRNIVHTTVDSLHLIDDTVGNASQQLVGETIPVSRHVVGCLHTANCRRLCFIAPHQSHLLIGSAVTHHTHRTHRQQHNQRLTNLLILARRANLVNQNLVRLT